MTNIYKENIHIWLLQLSNEFTILDDNGQKSVLLSDLAMTEKSSVQ